MMLLLLRALLAPLCSGGVFVTRLAPLLRLAPKRSAEHALCAPEHPHTPERGGVPEQGVGADRINLEMLRDGCPECFRSNFPVLAFAEGESVDAIYECCCGYTWNTSFLRSSLGVA